jgi:hypothetical protein
MDLKLVSAHRIRELTLTANTKIGEGILNKAVVRQLVLLSHEGRSWTKRSSSPKTIHDY